MKMQMPGSNHTFPLSPVIETIPTPVNKTGLWRFLTPVRKELVSPCRALCPLESKIPLWMEEIKKGNWEQAWQVMEQFNPFPALTGYACYQFCRSQCSRGEWDEPVAIRDVEKALGLWRQKNYRSSGLAGGQKKKQSTGEKTDAPRIIIVGSGPAGLSSAYYLNRMGTKVTVLEKEPVAGGLLATGIPRHRLPREILEKELLILQEEGIVIKTGREMGRDFLLKDLTADCEALLLCVGAGEINPLGVPGDNLPGVIGAIDFLKEVHLESRPVVSGVVLVIGGGNAAVDASTVAALSGAEEVILAYRRSEEVMPAHPEEVKAAGDANVKFLFNVVLDEIHGSGSVEKVTLSRVRPAERGEEVRRISGSSFTLECQMIINATGQKSSLPGLVSLPESGEAKAVGFIGEGCSVSAAGDAVTGPSNIAAAIFSGRQAALNLAGVLFNTSELGEFLLPAPALEKKDEPVPFETLNPYLYAHREVSVLPEKEAARCFSCGNCNNCGVCWAFCPELAMVYEKGVYELQLDYCKGCGICAAECPTGVLFMEEVSDSGTQINER